MAPRNVLREILNAHEQRDRTELERLVRSLLDQVEHLKSSPGIPAQSGESPHKTDDHGNC